jgi:CBS domain-containing protein
VVTTTPHSTIKDAAKLLLSHHISGLPVVDNQGKIVGIISEGDLFRRAEIATERTRSWWLQALSSADSLATEYVKANARKVEDVMSRHVIMAVPETSLQEIATILEMHGIKRVPIVENGQLVGIISRANLIQALASAGSRLEIPLTDTAIRSKLVSHLRSQQWADISTLNVIVTDGVVDLWGVARSDTERKAFRVAAEATPGIRVVNDHMKTWHVEAG